MNATAAADIEKSLTTYVSQNFRHSGCGLSNSAFIDNRKKVGPVLPEPKANLGIHIVLHGMNVFDPPHLKLTNTDLNLQSDESREPTLSQLFSMVYMSFT